MTDIIIFDTENAHENLLPVTYTRPTGAIRTGIITIAEKWQKRIPGNYSWSVAKDYMSELFPADPAAVGSATTLHIAGHVIPDDTLAATVAALKSGQALYADLGDGCEMIARRGSAETERIMLPDDRRPACVRHPYDIFLLNGSEIAADFALLTAGRSSAPLSDTNTVIGDSSAIFLEEGATVEGAFINVKNGPVYIARDAEVMEGSMLRGPIAVGEHSVVNMGTKIYPGTTLGPFCKVGGELNNVVMNGYSNKGHDGFLGNAVIGEWCNLGAGCTASNLKNDYTPIKLWNYPAHRFLKTGLIHCGLIMGDHSKAGINTMFNTATVIGVGVNIHGAGYPRNFVASFSEGGPAGFTDVAMSKFFDTARRMMERRGKKLTDADERMFLAIREIAENYK